MIYTLLKLTLLASIAYFVWDKIIKMYLRYFSFKR